MLIYQLCFSGFSLDPVDMGTSAGDKVLIGGGTHEGGIDIMGDLTLINYIINYKYCFVIVVTIILLILL